MNGISLVIPKSCSLMYNSCKSKKIKFGTKNKISFIPHRLSNLHLQRSFIPTTRVLKHRVYAGTVDVKGSKFEVPDVSGAVIPYVLPGVGLIGMAFGIALGTLKSKACYYILLGVTAVSVATGLLCKIMYLLAVVLLYKAFSAGDIIEVENFKGQVLETGYITTSLLTAESRRVVVPTSWFYRQVLKNISRDVTSIPNTLLFQDFVNESRAPYHAMVSKIPVQVDEIGKINKITEEIMNMMKSNSNVYLEKEQPYCYRSEVKADYVELILQYNLKQMSQDKLYSSKQDVLVQSAQIIKKHGATLSFEEWEASKDINELMLEDRCDSGCIEAFIDE